jgi:tetratricopeptide (TPR) repeat protein
VGSILKALGLTIWGAIAVLLSVIFIIVAYQVAMKYRASRSAFDFDNSLNDESTQSQPESSVGSVSLPDRAPDLRVPLVVPQVVPQVVPGVAEETDCADGRGIPHVALDSPQRTRLARLLDSSEAAKAESGNAFIRLGEMYYGFGEYELAVAAIERGLEKGHVVHLGEAYVYLGRSEVAIGDLDAAREAFAKLKDVPGISARVLKLWTLYAETQLSTSKVRSAPDRTECQKAGTGGL